VIAAIGAGAWFYLHRAPALTSKDSVILADFTTLRAIPFSTARCGRGLSRSSPNRRS